MTIPNLDPTTTLKQYVDIDIFNAANFWAIPYQKTATEQNYIGQMEAYYAWFELAAQTNVAYYQAAQLDLIIENTTGIVTQLQLTDTNLQTRMSDETTTLLAAIREVFIPLLIEGLGGSPKAQEETNAILTQAITPLLARSATTLEETNAILTQAITPLLARSATTLEENLPDLNESVSGLADSLKDIGGQDFATWLAGVTPHSDPSPEGKVVTTENVSPFIRMGTATFGFLIEKTGMMLKDILGAVFKVTDAVSPVFTPLIDTVLQQVEDRATTLGEVTPGDAFPLARKFIIEAFQNGLKARLISILLEKAGDQVKNLGIQQIAGLVGELSGFSQLAEAVHGTQLKAAVARPAEYQINAQTRTRLLNPGETIEAAVERKLSLEEQRQILRYHGYNEHHIDVIQAYMWRDPRLREIVLLSSDVSVNDDDVRHWLSEAGYDDNDIERMAPVVIQQSLKPQRQALTNEVLANVRAGTITDEDAEAQFARLRFPEEATRLMMDAGRLGFRREMIALNISELEQMFQLSQIGEPELRLALQAQGLNKARIEIVIGKAVSKFAGRVSKEEQSQVDADVRKFQAASLAAMKEQFQVGLISAEAFEVGLVSIGFLPGVARQIVILEQTRSLTKLSSEREADAERLREEIRRNQIAAYVELFRDGFIDEGQLRFDLLAVGLAPELADSLILRELARKEPPAPAPKPPPTH